MYEDGAVFPDGGSVGVFKVAIRFSNFGHMATIQTNSPKSKLDNYPVEELAKLVEEYGFRYVSVDVLRKLYDGKFRALDNWCGGNATWWDRFFEYM